MARNDGNKFENFSNIIDSERYIQNSFLCQIMSNYVKVCQSRSKYVKVRQSTSKYVKVRQSTSKYVKVHQSTSKYVKVRQSVSLNVSQITQPFILIGFLILK